MAYVVQSNRRAIIIGEKVNAGSNTEMYDGHVSIRTGQWNGGTLDKGCQV